MISLACYMITGVVVFGMGLAGVFLCPHPLRKILAINVAGSGAFLMFVTLARRSAGDSTLADAGPDPVPHALVLTGIVVAVSATAVALALLRKLSELES